MPKKANFNKYYQDELNYLRDLGREFAQEYPSIAKVLGDAGRDPDVDRLLEGTAFLTGRIRQKIDDDVPEFIHSVSGLLFPHLLRPIPAATIIELTPKKESIRGKCIVEAGAAFDGKNKDGSLIRFCSTVPCEVLPWSLERLRLESGANHRQSLVFDLVSFAGFTLGRLNPTHVRLHFAEDSGAALTLLAGLVTQAHRVLLQATEPSGQVRAVELDASAIKQVGYIEDEALLPRCDTVLSGLRLAEEYFTFPQKFAFVDIGGLEELVKKAPACQGITVTIELKAPLSDLHHLAPDSIRLHCVPAVNVYRSTAEPIRVERGRERYTVHPVNESSVRGSVYTLCEVTGIERATGRRFPVLPVFEFASDTAQEQSSFVYAQHLAPSVIGNDADLMISLEATQTRENSSSQVDVLSIDLLATHGHAASKVPAGAVQVATPTSPTFASFRNIAAVTPYVPVPLGRELQWRAVAHVSMGLRSLTDPNVLRSMLSVYNLIGLVNQQAERANEQRIQAIRAISVKPSEHVYRGCAIRGISVEVDLDDSSFAADGDFYLFSTILDHLFASYVPLNSFASTCVRGLQSQARIPWPARHGTVALL